MLFDLDLLSIFRRDTTEEPAWWIEAKTSQPPCTYYFGPYSNRQDAVANQAGFFQDLASENAVGIDMSVKRTNPDQLTIIQD